MLSSRPFRLFALGAALLAALPLAAADNALLSLVMKDARVVGGISVDQARNSAFGRYVLGKMQTEDEGFRNFIAATGFDPRRDLREIVMASDGQPRGKGIVVARGNFNVTQILNHATAHGGVASSYKGVTLMTGKRAGMPAFAFLDNSLAVAGSPDEVRGAIDRWSAPTPLDPQMDAKVRSVSTIYDAWMVTSMPVAELAANAPDPRLGPAMKGDMLKTISQVSGGVKFLPTGVDLAAEAVTHSPQDATALADVIRFLSNMVAGSRATSEQPNFAALVRQMQLDTSGNLVRMTLSIPEDQLEKIIESQGKRVPSARPSRRPAAAL